MQDTPLITENTPAGLTINGIRLGVAQAGIKTPHRNDLVIIEINQQASVAGVFTQNIFCAPPVILSKRHLDKKMPRALLINTGNANAATGELGLRDALACAESLAEKLHIDTQEILTFSTGVIGEPLPREKIIRGLDEAIINLQADNWHQAALGIMTTDTQPKLLSKTVMLGTEKITITGIAKGSGMIAPNMATMLAFIATDAHIDQLRLKRLLKEAVAVSFNSITVDSDTSTNDSCIFIATGCHPCVIDDHNEALFLASLKTLMIELAQMIVRDGEGATKFITITINNGLNEHECRQVAFSIANSPLVKTALFACDPNWGRIIMAIGKSGISQLDPHKINVNLNGIRLLTKGLRDPDYREEMGADALKHTNIVIEVDLQRGNKMATVWTCDFSYEYVKINSEYRS